MNLADANAIAEFLKDGGEVIKVKDTVPATEQEVLDYLATCGIHAKYMDGDLKPYLQDKKRYSALGLVALANEFRRDQQLAPFALRMNPSPRRRSKEQDA